MNASNYSQIYQENIAWAEVCEAEHGVPLSVHTDEDILTVSHCNENLPWLDAGDAVVVQLSGHHAMVLYKVVNISSHQPAILPTKHNSGLRYSHKDSEIVLKDDGKLLVKTPEIAMLMDSEGNFLVQAENIEINAEKNINFYCDTLSIETK